MKDPDVAKGITYIVLAVVLTAITVLWVLSELDRGEERERSRDGQSQTVERRSNFNRKFDYCMREHGVDLPGAFLKCLNSPLPR